jgi:hypothetical protein
VHEQEYEVERVFLNALETGMGLRSLFVSEPSTVNVQVDENRIMSDVLDQAHLNARRATQGK